MSCIVNGPVATKLDVCVHLGSPQNYSNYVKATPDSIGKKKLPPRWNVMGIITKLPYFKAKAYRRNLVNLNLAGWQL